MSGLVYDPDVFTGIVCHSELGFHKHGTSGPELWFGVVVTVPLDGGPLLVKAVNPDQLARSILNESPPVGPGEAST